MRRSVSWSARPMDRENTGHGALLESARSQPRRDCGPHLPHAARARDRDGCRLLRGRPRLAARWRRRRGVPHRPGVAGGELPEPGAHPRGGGSRRGEGHPPRIRLPRRERDVRLGTELGWPLAIKAAAGGGGKGLKVVAGPDEAERALESARREGQAYFSDLTVYVERYLEDPRHVEVQVV